MLVELAACQRSTVNTMQYSAVQCVVHCVNRTKSALDDLDAAPTPERTEMDEIDGQIANDLVFHGSWMA